MRKQWLGICIAASLLAACTSDDGQQQATVARRRSLRFVMARSLKSAVPIPFMNRSMPARIRITSATAKATKLFRIPPALAGLALPPFMMPSQAAT